MEAEYFAGIRRCIKLRYVVRISSIAAHDDFHVAFSLKVWNKITVEISSFVVICPCACPHNRGSDTFVKVERCDFRCVKPAFFSSALGRNVKTNMHVRSNLDRAVVYVIEVKGDETLLAVRKSKSCVS